MITNNIVLSKLKFRYSRSTIDVVIPCYVCYYMQTHAHPRRIVYYSTTRSPVGSTYDTTHEEVCVGNISFANLDRLAKL